MGYQPNRQPLQPGYARKLGATAADALEQAIPSERFFHILEEGVVGFAELDELVEFCPCRVKHNESERELLTSLLFARRPDAERRGAR